MGYHSYVISKCIQYALKCVDKQKLLMSPETSTRSWRNASSFQDTMDYNSVSYKLRIFNPTSNARAIMYVPCYTFGIWEYCRRIYVRLLTHLSDFCRIIKSSWTQQVLFCWPKWLLLFSGSNPWQHTRSCPIRTWCEQSLFYKDNTVYLDTHNSK